MNIEEIRRQNLIAAYELADKANGAKLTWTEFGKRIGMSKSTISQHKTTRRMSSKTARLIEEKMGLEKGYMDDPNNIIQSSKYKDFLSAVLKEALELSNVEGMTFDPDQLSQFIIETYEELSSTDSDFTINSKIISSLLRSSF